VAGQGTRMPAQYYAVTRQWFARGERLPAASVKQGIGYCMPTCRMGALSHPLSTASERLSAASRSLAVLDRMLQN
jgi:hypothetical protein